jgi:hypothetical protein
MSISNFISAPVTLSVGQHDIWSLYFDYGNGNIWRMLISGPHKIITGDEPKTHYVLPAVSTTVTLFTLDKSSDCSYDTCAVLPEDCGTGTPTSKV